MNLLYMQHGTLTNMSKQITIYDKITSFLSFKNYHVSVYFYFTFYNSIKSKSTQFILISIRVQRKFTLV